MSGQDLLPLASVLLLFLQLGSVNTPLVGSSTSKCLPARGLGNLRALGARAHLAVSFPGSVQLCER